MAREGDFRKAHSTPLIVTNDGKLQMLSAGAKPPTPTTRRPDGTLAGPL